MVAACLDWSRGSYRENVGRAWEPEGKGRPHLAGKIRGAFMEEVRFKQHLGQTLDERKHSKWIFPSRGLKMDEGSEKRKCWVPDGEWGGCPDPTEKRPRNWGDSTAPRLQTLA